MKISGKDYDISINDCRHCGRAPKHFTEHELKIQNPPPNLYQLVCVCGMQTKCDVNKKEVVLIWNGAKSDG